MDFSIQLLQQVIIGLGVGLIIATGAMGLALAYGVERYPNVAHGYLMTAGMFAGYSFSRLIAAPESFERTRVAFPPFGRGTLFDWGWEFSFGWDFLGALVVAALAGAALAVLSDRLVFRLLRKRKAQIVTFIIASLGVAIVLRAGIQAIWGAKRQLYYAGITNSLELADGLRLDPDLILFALVTLIVTVGLYLLLYKTRIGKALRATSDNPDLAAISGIDTDRVRIVMWAVAGALAGVAGALYGMQVEINYTVGFLFLLPMFAAVILGGIGSPWGALGGALLVGVTQEVSTLWIPTGFKLVVPFVAMILVLLVRPQGLFGRRD